MIALCNGERSSKKGKMGKYILRRFLFSFFTLIGATAIVFGLSRAVGDLEIFLLKKVDTVLPKKRMSI